MLFGFKSFTQVVLTVYLLFAMAAACVTALTIHTQRNRAAEQVRTDLIEVADTRVGQIAAWRAERMGDAQTLQRSPFLNQVLTGGRRQLSNPTMRRTLEEWMDGLSPYLRLFRHLRARSGAECPRRGRPEGRP